MISEERLNISVPSRVWYKGQPGVLWGVGYDPKGYLYMVRLDSGETYVSARANEIVLESPNRPRSVLNYRL